MSIPRTTHPWLQPLYNRLEGKGTAPLQLGSSTGALGLYGFTGYKRIATGGAQTNAPTALGASGFAATSLGGSGLYTFLGQAGYGSTGTRYTGNDLADAMKNAGLLPL